MLHLKSYVGSIVLAGLLLQGCGSSTSDEVVAAAGDSATLKSFNATSDAFAAASDADKAQAQSDLAMKLAALYASDADVKAYMDSVIADNDEIHTIMEAAQALAEAITSGSTSASKAPLVAGIFSPITDKLKDGLVDVLDTSVGNTVTAATFDVVLNSDGVTVVMLDAARKSHTTAQIMVDALEAKWELTEKMCPMLRENQEFGEKFVALAEEDEVVGRFFFERIDPLMYACLTDAMLLSNHNTKKGDYSNPIKYSTNGYMGVLMDRFATDYFIAPTGSTEVRRNDKFVSLLLDTGANVTYDSATRTFENHGDGNELTNEKFFYSLFKTPETTASFISAMEKIDPAVKKMLMDNIFLGTKPSGDADTIQGYLNIISIGSSMYDGIYGTKNSDGIRQDAYGFGAYTADFINFALLIPSDRYTTYGKAFINAGYQYAAFHGIDVWSGVSDAIKTAWNNYTTTPVQDGAPAQSAGMGLTGSDWIGDIKDLFVSAWGRINYSDLYTALTTDDLSIMDVASAQAKAAYHTVIDGRDDNGTLVKDWSTEVTNDSTIYDDEVYGFHGLLELATQEDIYYATCGNRSTDHIGIIDAPCENNNSYTMADAKAAFTLPPLADLTWTYAYTTASEGAMAYFKANVNADWFADLSTNDLIREYFYPNADNVYIPRWMLAINWLKVADHYNNATIATTDFDFNAGYFDIYVTSTDDNILVAGSDIDLAQVVTVVKEINVTQVDMGSDSIIAVDENGTTLDGLYVYKVRTLSPADTQKVLTYLSNLGDTVLSAIGLDSSNAANVDTTDANATN